MPNETPPCCSGTVLRHSSSQANLVGELQLELADVVAAITICAAWQQAAPDDRGGPTERGRIFHPFQALGSGDDVEAWARAPEAHVADSGSTSTSCRRRKLWLKVS